MQDYELQACLLLGDEKSGSRLLMDGGRHDLTLDQVRFTNNLLRVEFAGARDLHWVEIRLSEGRKCKLDIECDVEGEEDYCFTGFLPRIYEQSQRPTTAYSNYYQTYLERDVRQLIQLKDASLLEKMIKLLAGRIGQTFDYSSLANDVGVDAKTIRHWMSILEASFIILSCLIEDAYGRSDSWS